MLLQGVVDCALLEKDGIAIGAALREGADLAVCDASFGFDGSTALYLSTRHLPGSRCALVSRALLDKVRAAARGKDSVTELLRLAHAMAQHSRCIPQALLHFRRELCADDVFSGTPCADFEP